MLWPVLLLLFPGASAPDAPSSAASCVRCHRAIYEHWKTSGHARAYQSPLFQDVLERADADFPNDGRKVCLGCHAPILSQAGEGVTCDYCHSIRQVAFDGPNPKAGVTFSNPKAGPDPHQNPHPPLHARAEVCAPCHEHRNASGFAVLTTYTEWKGSRYAKAGRPCQACHMPGDLHEMRGGHSIEQLAKAIQARISTARRGAQLKVTVEIANEGAGHYFPTGSPLRQMLLELRADSAGGQHFREQRLYARQVADQHGTVLMREHFAFLKAAQVDSDTRLAPREKRTETFFFPIPKGDPARLEATLWYIYSPLAQVESQARIAFLTLRRSVP